MGTYRPQHSASRPLLDMIPGQIYPPIIFSICTRIFRLSVIVSSPCLRFPDFPIKILHVLCLLPLPHAKNSPHNLVSRHEISYVQIFFWGFCVETNELAILFQNRLWIFMFLFLIFLLVGDHVSRSNLTRFEIVHRIHFWTECYELFPKFIFTKLFYVHHLYWFVLSFTCILFVIIVYVFLYF